MTNRDFPFAVDASWKRCAEIIKLGEIFVNGRITHLSRRQNENNKCRIQNFTNVSPWKFIVSAIIVWKRMFFIEQWNRTRLKRETKSIITVYHIYAWAYISLFMRTFSFVQSNINTYIYTSSKIFKVSRNQYVIFYYFAFARYILYDFSRLIDVIDFDSIKIIKRTRCGFVARFDNK